MPAPEGMYTFKIDFKSVNNDDIHSINGHVMLIR
jgi:hypothetical protein